MYLFFVSFTVCSFFFHFSFVSLVSFIHEVSTMSRKGSLRQMLWHELLFVWLFLFTTHWPSWEGNHHKREWIPKELASRRVCMCKEKTGHRLFLVSNTNQIQSPWTTLQDRWNFSWEEARDHREGTRACHKWNTRRTKRNQKHTKEDKRRYDLFINSFVIACVL